MVQNVSHYSQSQGLKLLESAVREFGPIFILNQLKPIALAQKLSDSHLRVLISSLASAGWIEIIKRGTYVVKSSLFSGDIPPFAIAAALVQPMAISHWSALAHHGFTTQNTAMIQASTPHKVITPEMRSGKAYRPRGRACWRAFGLEFEFIYTKKDWFWGSQRTWVNSWQQVDITDPERTALDLIVRPDIFGGISAASEILEGALSQINPVQLVNYALQYNVGAVIKRLGWLLEKMDVDDKLLNPLRNFPIKGIILLDVNQPKGENYDSRWQINENLKRI
jgi:predicted transcriptional regulator of viral defense system